MARKTQIKNKDLCNLEVVTSDKVWNKDHKSFKKDLDIYGRVEKRSSYIASTNKKGANSKFLEDFSNLHKKTKNANPVLKSKSLAWKK